MNNHHAEIADTHRHAPLVDMSSGKHLCSCTVQYYNRTECEI